MLHQLAVCVSGHIQCWYRYVLASRGNAQKVPRVCPTKRETGGDGLTLGDHLIDTEVSIRESSVEGADKGFETLATRRESRGKRMVDVIGKGKDHSSEKRRVHHPKAAKKRGKRLLLDMAAVPNLVF